MKKVLLAGYYGFGNLGDEAILEMFLKYFNESGNIDEIVVLSGNPVETTSNYGVKAIKRFNLIAIITGILKTDALVFGGGSLLQDVTSKKSILYYLFLIKIAVFFNKKVLLLSQGIGPIVHESNLRAASKLLNKAEIITVRDSNSAEVLKKMGVASEKIEFSADPVIDIEFNHEDSVESINIDKPETKDKTKICFILRNWKEVKVIEQISFVVEKLYEQGIECTFICFHYSMDIELLEQLEKRLGNKAIFIKNRLTTKKALNIISNSDLAIGVRLHSLILAAAVKTPFIALSYDPKIDYFLECFDLDSFTDMNNVKMIDANALLTEIDYKLNNIDKEKKSLEIGVEKLKKTIDVNIDIINNL